jgi:3'-phosphoadenosine 5'-phosphosulfate sulfotransferase (PAPS reductase)/FAD synthetase
VKRKPKPDAGLKIETLERHHPNADALCRYVAEHSGDTALLSFSAGKDAVVAWIQMRKYFKRIVPFYLYLIPDLEFVEEGLRYYENLFETKIHRYPNPNLLRMLRNYTFQPPSRWPIIQDWELRVSYADIEADVRRKTGTADAFVGFGTRTADSPTRLANVRRFGSLTPGRRSFLPVFDWRIADVVTSLKSENIKLTVDYRHFGRSYDGIDHRFLAPIKQHYPRDYARILEWFPMAELEFMRRNLAPEVA